MTPQATLRSPRSPRQPAAHLLMALVLCGLAPHSAPAQTPQRAAAATAYTFAFQDADLATVADAVLGETLGLGFTVDAGLTTKISFRIDQRLTRAQLLDAFEAALATRDIVMVRQGERLFLTERSKAKGAGNVRLASEASGGGYRLATVPLTHAQPSEVAKGLQSLGMGPLVAAADDRTGTLVIGGTARELAAAQDAIRLFDRGANAGLRNRLVELHNASVAEVSSDVAEVLKATDLGGVQVIPIQRLNALLVFARTDEALNQAQGWITRLDSAASKDQASLWIYKPRNVSAEALSETLNAVLAGAATEVPTSASASRPGLANGASTGAQPAARALPSAAPRASGPAGDHETRVAVDRDSNTLLLSGPPSKRAEIQRILAEIDVLPRQVLIEASIIEVTLGNEFRLGVNWSLLSNDGRVKVIQTDRPSGVIAPTLPSLAITYLSNDVSAAIDALRARTSVRVLSAPKLVALDNRVARLQIGDQVPVATESSQSTASADAPRLVTIDYRNTGVIMEVTPRITGEDGVTLAVSQEVSSVARTTTSGIDSPTIRQRRFDSVLLVKSGATVALGGLISASVSGDSTGVPELEKTPIIGNLFKTQSKDRRRTELIVLLTARILPDASSAASAARAITEEMKSIDDHGFRAP